MSIQGRDCAEGTSRQWKGGTLAGCLTMALACCFASIGCGCGKQSKEATIRLGHAPMRASIPSGGEALPSGETYKKIHEHPFVPASILPFSTFSVDVDTASYSNVRRMLNDGMTPPKDAVRIEEMINYFKYDYADPEGAHPLAIATEMAACPWNPKHLLARIAVQAKRVEGSKLPPMNLVFLLDTSGSMSGENRLPLLKKGLALLANKLRPQDRVAIVTYAGSAGLVLPSTSGADRDAIKAALDRLQAGGGTHGSAGIALAYKVAETHFVDGGINRVIIGSDGDFNVGLVGKDLIDLIAGKRKTGIYLTVLGFGMGNLKDETMESLAEHGNGNYAYIDTLQEAKRVMVDNISHLQPLAKDVKIQVEFNTAKVLYYRLIGYDNRLLAKEDFENDAKDAGDMGAGQQVTAIYEVIPHAEDAEMIVEGAPSWGEAMMKVKLRYIPPTGKASVLLEQPLQRGDLPLARASLDFRFAAGVAAFGMVLRDTPEKGNATFALAAQLAGSALGRDGDGSRAELMRLIERAKKGK